MKIYAKLSITALFGLITLISCEDANTTTDSTSNQTKAEHLDLSEDTNNLKEAQEEKKFDVNSLKDITKNLPSDLIITGEIINAYQWNDANGNNILVNSIKKNEEKNEYDDDLISNAYLHSNHYIKNDNGYDLIVATTAKETACDFDLYLEFKGKPLITDADNNGIAEVIICIRKTCIGGEQTPATLKVLMHENTQEYALCGLEYLEMFINDALSPESVIDDSFIHNLSSLKDDVDIDYKEMGRYKNDNDFKNAPKPFLTNAIKVWKQNVIYHQ